MPSYMFVYRSEPFDFSKMSPDQMQKSMELWTAWIGKGFQEGWLADAGDALLPDGKVVNAAHMVTDGPFMEANEVVGGYGVVKAATYEEAITYAKTCPHLVEGGRVEIRQMAGVGAPKE